VTGAANHACVLFLRVPNRASNGAWRNLLKASEASPTAGNTDDAGFLVAQAPGRFIPPEKRVKPFWGSTRAYCDVCPSVCLG